MKKFLLLCVISLLLTGCWDQRMLKDANVVSIIGMDETTEGEIESTVAIPKGSVGENQDIIARIESATGETVKNSRNNLDKKMGKESDASKNEFLLLGEELVKDEIYSVLDIYYREPRSALNTKVAITEGKAKDFIHLEIDGEPSISSYFLELIKSAETNTISPDLNLQSLCSLIFDPGQDFALPYLRIADDEKSAEMIGLVMFHEEMLSGLLTAEEGMMFLLLADQKGKKVQITKKVESGSDSDRKNYITVIIKKATRKLDIQSEGGQGIQVNLELDLQANVVEYPKDQLNKKSMITHLNKKLSELLTKSAEETISKMQEANSDLLGIGRRLMAHHPEVWKKTDWKTEYPKIQIKSKVNVTVETHGIIN